MDPPGTTEGTSGTIPNRTTILQCRVPRKMLLFLADISIRLITITQHVLRNSQRNPERNYKTTLFYNMRYKTALLGYFPFPRSAHSLTHS